HANDNVVSIAQTGTTPISYAALNRPSVRTLPSAVNTTWSYDSHGFVSGIVAKLPNGAAHDTHFFTRDAVGNITVDSANAQNFTCAHDDLYRWSSATVLGTGTASSGRVPPCPGVSLGEEQRGDAPGVGAGGSRRLDAGVL